jgi:hypothetical protein
MLRRFLNGSSLVESLGPDSPGQLGRIPGQGPRMDHSIVLGADPFPLAALLVGHTRGVCALLTPCHRGRPGADHRPSDSFEGPQSVSANARSTIHTIALPRRNNDPTRKMMVR